MKWISVKDKLPEDADFMCKYDWVLVCGESSDMLLVGLAQCDDGIWDICNDVGVHSCTGMYTLKSEEITHWMPILNLYKDINDNGT